MKSQASRGFTLIEVLMTILVIGGALVIYGVATTSLLIPQSAEKQEIALRIARSKIEDLRASGYAALPGSGTFTDAELALLPSASSTLEVSVYNSQTKKIKVNVYWKDRSYHAVSLTSLITQSGGL